LLLCAGVALAGLTLGEDAEKVEEPEEDADEDQDEDEDDNEAVVVLSDSNFHEFVKKHDRVLAEFYAPWCGHCKSLEPEYEKAAQDLLFEGLATKFVKVDATVNTKLATEFEVKSYPTLKYFAMGSEPVEYDGGRDAKGLAGWARKRELPTVTELDEAGVEGFLKKHSGDFAFVAFVKRDSVRAKAFFKAAESIVSYDVSTLRFAAVWLPKSADAKKAAKLWAQRPDWGADSQDYVPARLDYTGSWSEDAIGKWAKQSTYAAVGSKFDAKKYAAAVVEELGSDGTVVVLLDNKEAQAPKIAPGLARLSAAESKWRFTTAAVSELSEADLAVLGARRDQKLMISVLHKGKKYTTQKYLDADQDLEKSVEKSAVELLGDVKSKKAKPHYKSAAAPKEEFEDGVRVLTGNTFEQYVLNSKKDVFVEFYAPWCGHCKSLVAEWRQLAQAIEKKGFAKKGVIVAKMDSTENECEETVEGYPKLVFYPAVRAEKKFKQKLVFQGKREFEPLFDFLLENAVNLAGEEADEAGFSKKPASLLEREKKAKKSKKKAEL